MVLVSHEGKMDAKRYGFGGQSSEDGLYFVNSGTSSNRVLPVRDPSHYIEHGFKAIFDPKILEAGNFSVDEERRFVNNQSQLKYVYIPPNRSNLHWDLNLGYEHVIKKDRLASEKLDFLLRWILENRQALFTAGPNSSTLMQSMPVPVTFCCLRGLLTVILTTPYEKREDWIICATKFKRTIYLCAFPTESKIKRESSMTEREKLMCSWGYKFEQYATKDSPTGSPEALHMPVNEKTEYCAVFRNKFSDDDLLYVAEVDAVASAESMASNNVFGKYVELKTSRIITSHSQDINFRRHKLLKWWAQSYLAAVKKLYCGFRDDDGIVQCFQAMAVCDLPLAGQSFWSPYVCLNFALEFLSFVKSVAVKDDPNVVYKFEWKPGLNITCEELHTSTAPEFQILPNWYTSQIKMIC